jgi:dipeptidyl aminopeptidase/acylaminoacyl peptidase
VLPNHTSLEIAGMISPMLRRIAALLLAAWLHPSALAGEMPLAAFANIKNVTSALLSPDGRELAYMVALTDLKANRVKTEIWLMPVHGDPRRVPFETDAIQKILWSPRGGQLAVVGTVSKGTKDKVGTYLWLLDVDSGQSKRLIRIERSNHYLAHQGTNLCWSPDGNFLAYLAADAGPAKSEKESSLPGGPIVIARIQYKTRTALSDNRRTHIFTIDTTGGALRQLTSGPYDEHSIDWSPRGDEIAFCSNRGPDPDANLNYDLYTVNVADGKVRQLTKTAGSEMAPVWSPDGRSLAYTMTKRPLTTIDSVAEDDHVWVLDRKTGRAQELTAKLDRRCAHVRWDPDGKHVCFLARDHGYSKFFKVPAQGGEAKTLPDSGVTVSSFSLARGPGSSALVISGPTLPPEVVLTFQDPAGIRRIHLNDLIGTRWRLTKPVEVNYKSFDLAPIQGWLMVPPGATADKKVPLILYVHGGPHGMYGLQFSATFQLMCARGYAVLFLNPRGSSGYGQHFSDGCVGDWGGGDYADLMAGLDHVLAKHPELDAERLGVTGGSYGGYMTNWMITQTGRFKAAITYASLSNLISFYATSLYQDLIHVDFKGEPWDRYDILWERSPLRHIRRVTTPTLILHGEADNDVHITQSEELYTALRRRGVETVFVRYPREGHGATEPSFQLDQLERTAAWFDRFLKR